MANSAASFGYTDEEWELLVAAADERLTELIPTTFRSLPPYSRINREVPPSVGLPCFDLGTDHGREGLGHLLGSLNERLWDEAHCLVSSVVVHKGDAGSTIGRGFYAYALERGLDPGRTRAHQEDFLFTQQIAAVRFWQERRVARAAANSGPSVSHFK